MQEKHVYPNRKLYLALMDVLSKRGHNSVIVEVFIPGMHDKTAFSWVSYTCITQTKPITYQLDHSANLNCNKTTETKTKVIAW